MTRYLPPMALALLLAVGVAQAQQGDDNMNPQSPVDGVSGRFIESNGIRMRIFDAGDSGPLVPLAHGWPESWDNWRHQLTAPADAGYRAVAPDLRGVVLIPEIGHWVQQEAPAETNAAMLEFLGGLDLRSMPGDAWLAPARKAHAHLPGRGKPRPHANLSH